MNPEVMTVQDRISQGTYGMGGRKDTFTLFDTIRLKSGVQDYNLFTTPSGQTDAYGMNKTLSETNLIEAKKIPAGQGMGIRKFKINVTGISVLTEAEQLAFVQWLKNYVLTFKLPNSTEIIQLPISLLLGSAYNVMAADASNGSLSLPVFEGVYDLFDAPIFLQENTTFEMFLRTGHPTVASLDGKVEIKIFNVGTLYRQSNG